MVEYLRKIYDFFKTNEIAKDLFLGSIGAVVGGIIVNILIKRKNDWIFRYCDADICFINFDLFGKKNNYLMSWYRTIKKMTTCIMCHRDLKMVTFENDFVSICHECVKKQNKKRFKIFS